MEDMFCVFLKKTHSGTYYGNMQNHTHTNIYTHRHTKVVLPPGSHNTVERVAKTAQQPFITII